MACGQAAAQQILRRRGLEQSPASTGIKARHKSKLLTPSGLVDEAIVRLRPEDQMLPATATRFERVGELEFDLGFAEFSHFCFAIRVASSPALI